MKTNITKTMAKACTSNDDLRPALNGLYLDTDKNRLTGTDSRLLVNYKVEVSPEDNNGILPVDLFKSKKTEQCEYSVNGSAVRDNYNSKSEFQLIDEKYPEIDNVIPEDDNEDRLIGLDLNLLKNLCSAVPADDNGNKYVKFRISGNSLRAVKFEQLNDNPEYSGVIMPIRLED